VERIGMDPLRLAFGAREGVVGRRDRKVGTPSVSRLWRGRGVVGRGPPSRVWGEGGGCRQSPSVSHLGRGRGLLAGALPLVFGAREGPDTGISNKAMAILRVPSRSLSSPAQVLKKEHRDTGTAVSPTRQWPS
jgi:hypothetical protein